MKKSFRYYQRVYQKYKSEKNKYINSDIAFYNFWSENTIEDYWFYKFINYHKLNTKHKKLNFQSVFGPREIIYLTKKPKIFYTAENVDLEGHPYKDHYEKKVNLAMGFEELKRENYLRFPFWILRLVPADINFEDFKKLINKYNNPEHRLNIERQRFACNISRHDNSGLRGEIIDALSTIENIDCAGKFRNNTQELFEKFNNNKEIFLRNYKFNICPENSNAAGYVTEKPFEAIKSGCIPIYWGSNNNPEPEILNHDAILFFEKGEDNTKLLERIQKINSSEEEFKKFAEIRPFKENAAELIWQTIEELKTRILKITT